MRNQKIITILIVAALLRNFIPFVDIFIFVLVLLFLLNQERIPTISIIALLVSFFYSLFIDSPLGLFPLVLSLNLLIFEVLFLRITAKGITPLFIWLFFAFSVILIEALVRLVLTTGVLMFPIELLFKILGTIVLIMVVAFSFSLKRKI